MRHKAKPDLLQWTCTLKVAKVPNGSFARQRAEVEP
jgi:hypothetical protein